MSIQVIRSVNYPNLYALAMFDDVWGYVHAPMCYVTVDDFGNLRAVPDPVSGERWIR